VKEAFSGAVMVVTEASQRRPRSLRSGVILRAKKSRLSIKSGKQNITPSRAPIDPSTRPGTQRATACHRERASTAGLTPTELTLKSLSG